MNEAWENGDVDLSKARANGRQQLFWQRGLVQRVDALLKRCPIMSVLQCLDQRHCKLEAASAAGGGLNTGAISWEYMGVSKNLGSLFAGLLYSRSQYIGIYFVAPYLWNPPYLSCMPRKRPRMQWDGGTVRAAKRPLYVPHVQGLCNQDPEPFAQPQIFMCWTCLPL